MTISTTIDASPAAIRWDALAHQVITGHAVSRSEAETIVFSHDDQLLALLHAALQIRLAFHGRVVKVHVLRNAKSGVCPEDCRFCSQSLKHNAKVEQYGMQGVAELVQGAEEAVASGAVTYCMVTSTRGPAANDIETICAATQTIKQQFPTLSICASLGILDRPKAARLAAAGVDRYNHNLESSARFFGEVVSTHRFADRIATVQLAKAAGMQTCCGGILGMGESREDWVDLALTLRELAVESVPLNFLNPREGTPLGDTPPMDPKDCLRALAMFRFVHPQSDIRAAGGREVVLRSLQPLALYAANSIFSNGYLTTGGATAQDDLQMIKDAGFHAQVLAPEANTS